VARGGFILEHERPQQDRRAVVLRDLFKVAHSNIVIKGEAHRYKILVFINIVTKLCRMQLIAGHHVLILAVLRDKEPAHRQKRPKLVILCFRLGGDVALDADLRIKFHCGNRDDAVKRLNIRQVPIHPQIVHALINIGTRKGIVRQFQLVTAVKRGITDKIGIVGMCFAHGDEGDRVDDADKTAGGRHSAHKELRHAAQAPNDQPERAQPEQGDRHSGGETVGIFCKAELDRTI